MSIYLSKKITVLKEPLEIDLQLMASELDSSANNLFFLSKSILDDSIMVESFDKLIIEIEKEVEVISFDDNTVLYEYNDDIIIVHTFLGEKYILFDKAILSKIEKQLNSYRNLCL